MARSKSITLGLLNIKTQSAPSAAQNKNKYLALFEAASKISSPIKVRGNDHILIGRWYPVDSERPADGIYGVVLRFMNIDKNHPWLNSTERRPTEDFEEPKIPDNLYPNLREVNFFFSPKHHLFVFNTKHLAPQSAQDSLFSLLNDQKIKSSFGDVDVEVVSTHDAIDRILRLPKKTRLEIRISIPNPDDLSDAEKDYFESRRRENVRDEEVTKKSDHPEGIKPDDHTKMLVSLSRRDGFTTAIGHEDGVRKVESTKYHPIMEKFSYEEPETEKEALIRSAADLIQKNINALRQSIVRMP